MTSTVAAMPPAAAAPSGFFVMRTPLLPYDVLAAFGDSLEAGRTVDPDRLADALAGDRARLRTRLRETMARPEVREAIFLASPALEARLGAWARHPESRRGRHIERALLSYVARMASRPTPFGLFASVSVGAIGDHTHLVLDGAASCGRRSRLDVDYLVALADAIGRRREVRERHANDAHTEPRVRAGCVFEPARGGATSAASCGNAHRRVASRRGWHRHERRRVRPMHTADESDGSGAVDSPARNLDMAMRF